uniref:ADF-H domain-containing protein n=1 Tax=Heliothis virescens TaxID=7102 RepID=A0A2A4ITW0_HELVI
MIDAAEGGEIDLKEQQEAAATLRELFLKALGELNGKPCSIVTYEKTSLNAIFVAWHPDGSEIIVRDLETPACFKMSTALLRTPDLLAIKFNQPVELP